MIIDNFISIFFENAFQRRITEDKVRNLAETTLNHWFKIVLFGDQSHWSKELQGYMNKISKIKIKNNISLKKESYYQLLFSEYMEEDKNKLNMNTFLDWLGEISDEYEKDYKSKYNVRNMRDIIDIYELSKKFFNEISESLSKNEKVIINNVIKKILGV